jgi:GNAT superfamily N-acetyltransferase
MFMTNVSSPAPSTSHAPSARSADGCALHAAQSVSIVRFEPGHGPAVLEMVLTIQQQEFGLPVSADSQPDLVDIPGHYQLARGNFWVALATGHVVGSVGLLDIGEGRAALRKMFVAAPWRGGRFGVAQGLLDTLLQWCGGRGISEVWLGTTEKFLAAHRFYEKNGFGRVDRCSLPSRFPVMAVDTRFYRWTSPTALQVSIRPGQARCGCLAELGRTAACRRAVRTDAAGSAVVPTPLAAARLLEQLVRSLK